MASTAQIAARQKFAEMSKNRGRANAMTAGPISASDETGENPKEEKTETAKKEASENTKEKKPRMKNYSDTAIKGASTKILGGPRSAMSSATGGM